MARLDVFDHDGITHGLLNLDIDPGDVEPYIGQRVDGQSAVPVAFLRLGHCAVTSTSPATLREAARALAEVADRLDGHAPCVPGSLAGYDAERDARREAGR